MTFEERMVVQATWGRQYASSLASIERRNWFELKREYDAGELDEIESLILIHPEWYRTNRGRPSDCEVRGRATFGLIPGKGQRCQSDFIWGYECPFVSSNIHCDHLFPWSLGGPTVPENAIWLCDRHNQAKGSDWHLTVSPVRRLQWFDRTLQNVNTLVQKSAGDAGV
jgi:5-methylcytosine-specific restriction endonuclease McrA